METIGSRIRTIRKLNKINQVEFSNRNEISQATLSEIEQDKYKPSADTVLAIVEGYGADVEWLLLGAGKPEGRAFGLIGINAIESNLLLLFDKLKDTDQDENIEIIKLKISRY